MDTAENKIKKSDFLKLRDLNLSNLGEFLNEKNVDLIGYSRLENFDLKTLYKQAEHGDSYSFSLLAQFCVINAKTPLLRKQALDALKLLSMNVDGEVDNIARYYYAASLLRTDNVADGLRILKLSLIHI